MNVRPWDPFSPARVRGPRPVEQPRSTREEQPAGDGLDELKHAELVALAKARNLPAYGTKADLIARLRGA